MVRRDCVFHRSPTLFAKVLVAGEQKAMLSSFASTFLGAVSEFSFTIVIDGTTLIGSG